MPYPRFSLVIAAVAALVGLPAQASIISTFDDDADGWTVINDATTYHEASGGNPGGYLRYHDHATGITFRAGAPDKFLGDLGAYDGGTLSFDARLEYGSGRYLSGFGETTFRSSAGDVTLDLAPDDPVDQWQTWSAPLTASAWGVSEAQWDSVLADVTGLEIRLEAIYGNEDVGLDNVALVPEPATAMLLTGLALPLLWRRRRA
ncbi:MAG: hypothetical protein ACOCTI_02180 [Phycisphaeraceae bacterium]